MAIKGLSSFTLSRMTRYSPPATFEISISLIGITFTLAAVILAAWWLTHLTAPRPVAKLPSSPMAFSDNSAMMISRLFGVAGMRTESIEGLRLTGVYAGSRGGGFATFNSKKGAISVFVGDEIVPGVVLKMMKNDRVTVLAAGAQKELQLRGDSGSTAPSNTHPASQPSSVQARQPQEEK